MRALLLALALVACDDDTGSQCAKTFDAGVGGQCSVSLLCGPQCGAGLQCYFSIPPTIVGTCGVPDLAVRADLASRD
jgi:hypothetical protein